VIRHRIRKTETKAVCIFIKSKARPGPDILYSAHKAAPLLHNRISFAEEERSLAAFVSNDSRVFQLSNDSNVHYSWAPYNGKRNNAPEFMKTKY
jgi:hypothetical protein